MPRRKSCEAISDRGESPQTGSILQSVLLLERRRLAFDKGKQIVSKRYHQRMNRMLSEIDGGKHEVQHKPVNVSNVSGVDSDCTYAATETAYDSNE